MTKTTSAKKVLLNSVIYAVSGIITKCFSFFLLPLYTVYLTTEDYGITSLAAGFSSVMCYIVAFSLFSSIKRFYVDFKDEPEKLKRFYGSIVTFVFLSGLFFVLLLTLFKSLVSKYLFAGIDYYPIIFVCLISLVFHCQQMVYDNILKSQQKALKSSMYSLIFFLLSVTLNILFIVVFKLGALGSLLASAVAYFIFTVYFVLEMLVTKKMVFCMDWKLLKPALAYSLPIMPHNLSTHIASFVSKILIGGAKSLAHVGIYAVASQFATISDTIQYYVSSAYGPWLYEKLHAKETSYKLTIRQVSKLLAAVIGLFLIGISLFAHDYIVLFVDESYVEAWKFVPIIVIVYVIKIMYYFYVEVLFYYKKASKLLFVATLSSSVFNVLISAILIPIYGIYGSVLADILSMIIRVSIIVAISKEFEHIGLYVKDFIFNAIVIIAFIFLGLIPAYLKYENTFSIYDFTYKVLVVALYCGYILLTNKKQFKFYFGAFINRLKSRRG